MNNTDKKFDESHPNRNTSLAKPTLAEVARKYRVEDQAGALIPGSRLTKILELLELDQPLSAVTLEHLYRKGFWALLRYAKKEIAYSEFLTIAEPEQSARCLAVKKEQAEQKQKEEEAERKVAAHWQKIEQERAAEQKKWRLEQEQAAERKRAFDNDPKNIAKAKQFKLREKYGLSRFIEKADFPMLMDMLRRVDNGIRLSKDEEKWLSKHGNEYYENYYTLELREGFHKNEAEFHAGEFKKNKNLRSAVQASSHYRKCNRAGTAESMLAEIDWARLNDLKLKSALCTTYGGVKRDLGKLNEALQLGEQAHLLTPQNFHPCTLLGAVNMEIGHYALGQSWYAKAVERGYEESAVDDDLRGIFKRANKTNREDMRDYLLNRDSDRYSWARKNG